MIAAVLELMAKGVVLSGYFESFPWAIAASLWGVWLCAALSGVVVIDEFHEPRIHRRPFELAQEGRKYLRQAWVPPSAIMVGALLGYWRWK